MRHRLGLLLLVGLVAVACTDGAIVAPPPETVSIDVWYHRQSGPERRLIEEQVAAFNASQDHIVARLRLLADGAYEAQVREAVGTPEFPDVLTADGDLFYDLADAGELVDLNLVISGGVRSDLQPWVFDVATYGGGLYGLPSAASAVVLLYNLDRLDLAGRPQPAGVSSGSVFDGLLRDLAASAPGERVFDLRLGLDREPLPDWSLVGIAALLQSGGGGVFNRDRLDPRFTLNGPESIAVARRLQEWATDGLIAEAAPSDFARGRLAVMLATTTEAAVLRAEGVRFAVGPPPSFGEGSPTSIATHNWAIGTAGEHRDEALEFFEFMVAPPQSAAYATATLGLPASTEARDSGSYWEGPLRQLRDDVDAGRHVRRLGTTAWGEISMAVSEAVELLLGGAAAFETFDHAAEEIGELVAAGS